MALRVTSTPLVFLVVSSAVALSQDLNWDRLAVTFPKFTQQPLTIRDAEKAGWTQDGWCAGRRGKFDFYKGNRFTHKEDKATRLLYDCDGHIAGIQATITPTKGYPSQHQTPPWIPDAGGTYSLTAYFRHPSQICKCKKKCKDRIKNKPRVGSGLWIQASAFKRRRVSPEALVKIPMHTSGLEGSRWVEGTCIRGMGIHYHYNISVNMDCERAFPVFLLYNQASQQLSGFGWGAALNVASATWEKPAPSLFTRSMKRESVPTCLKDLSAISVQHIYLADPHRQLC